MKRNHLNTFNYVIAGLTRNLTRCRIRSSMTRGNAGMTVTAVLCLLAVSCAKENLSEEPLSPGAFSPVTFTATLGGPSTRTYLDGVQVKWQDTDELDLWYGTFGTGVTNTKYTIQSIDPSDARIATFQGVALESENYVAVYPHSSSNKCSEKGKVTTVFPTEQSACTGSFDSGANIAAAYTCNNTLHFKNMGGMVALKVSSAGGHIIRSIRLTGTSAMSGEVEIKRAVNEGYPGENEEYEEEDGAWTKAIVPINEPVLSSVTEGVNFVKLNCGDGIVDSAELGGSTKSCSDVSENLNVTKAGTKAELPSGDNTYYLVTIPGTHTGFGLTFVDSEGKAAVAKSSHPFTIERNSNTLIANISLSDADFKSDPQVYINEIDCENKKIELYNPGSESVDLSGWVLTKDESSWAFPVGSTIAAGGYLTVTCKQSDCSTGPMFGISGDKGFDLKLSNGSLVDRIDNLTSVTTIADGETYGRRTDGADEWVVFSTGTIYESGVCDGDNSKGTVKTKATDPVVLNEIDGNNKYIELYNPTEAAVSLTGWTLSKDGEIVWTAGDGVSINAGGYLVVYSKKSTIAPEGAQIFSSGISAAKSVQVILKDESGTVKDTYTRGEEGAGWGKTELPENKDASFSRVPNCTGDWKYATPTCGLTNGEKTGTIEQYPAANGVLVLNELDGNNKFIELYNTSKDYSISLEDVTIYKDDGTDPIWTGAPGYSIAPESWVLLYSEDVKDSHTDHDSGLFFSSGLSPKKTLKIEMKNAPASGDPATLDTFTRGVSPWGSKISEQSDSFGRTPDGTGNWQLTDSTPGAANGASKGDIPQE